MKSNPRPVSSIQLLFKTFAVLVVLVALQGCKTSGAKLDEDSDPHRRVAYARACAPFAAMSALAYAKTNYPECRGLLEDYLKNTGWSRVDSLRPTPRALDLGMSYDVWENTTYHPATVVIAFRGTDFTDYRDWRDNLWWVTRFFTRKNNQYRCAPESTEAGRVIDQYAKSGAVILTTGHSLGGGLAQAFRYAYPTNVAQSYVFDPSPVTARSGDHGKNDPVQADMDRILADELLPLPTFPAHRILRVYERGEILAYLRAQMRFLHPINEKIIEVRWDFRKKGDWISQHNMWTFATNIIQVADLPLTPPLAAGYQPGWQNTKSEIDRTAALPKP